MMNYKKNRLIAWLSAIAFVLCAELFHSAAGVEIFKWTDEDGGVHFSNRPPPEKDEADMEIFTYTAPPEVEIMAEDEVQPATKEPPRPDSGQRTAQPAVAASMANVTIYSAEWCGVCSVAKIYMKSKGIPYTDYDIDASASAKAEFKRLGGRGVPLILTGKQKMHGFNPTKLDEMVRKAGD